MDKSNKNFIQVLNEIRSELKLKYQDFKGIYHFGSRVKKNFSPDSDYDIVIIFDRKIRWQFESEILSIVYKYMIENDIIIDCHVYTEADIQNPATPFRYNVKTTGVFYGSQ